MTVLSCIDRPLVLPCILRTLAIARLISVMKMLHHILQKQLMHRLGTAKFIQKDRCIVYKTYFISIIIFGRRSTATIT